LFNVMIPESCRKQSETIRKKGKHMTTTICKKSLGLDASPKRKTT